MPLVSKTFDQLLDFTRTSSATFVGSNGLIQNTAASRNLLLYTQEFDNAGWLKTAATVTANTTVAPDSTSTADKLVATATTTFHGTSQTVTGTVASYTYSVYAKAAEYSKLQLANGSAGTWSATFDLATGATIATGGTAVLSSSIQSVGDGWYRCAVTFTGAAASTAHSAAGYPNTGATLNNFGASYTGDGTSGIFAWGAQLEAGSTATTYTRNNGGVFPPRFDYDPVTLAPKGLLIEEQRTNLALNSTLFTSTNWAKIDASLTTGINDPAGGTSATTLTATAANGTIQQAAISAVGTYSVSIWIRRRTGTGQIRIRCGDLTLIPITITSSWVRYTATAVATTTTIRLAVVLDVSGDEVDIWGGQIEAGAFPTSYIPTAGASTVTRTADQCSIVAPNFAPWFNQSEGSFVVDFDVVSAASTSKSVLTTNDGTSNNINSMYVFSNGTVYGEVRSGGSGQATVTLTSATANTTFKGALAYKANDFTGASNGLSAGTDTSGAVALNQSEFNIGSARNYGTFLNGHIRSIRYYPTRLTNAQLQALTA